MVMGVLGVRGVTGVMEEGGVTGQGGAPGLGAIVTGNGEMRDTGAGRGNRAGGSEGEGMEV